MRLTGYMPSMESNSRPEKNLSTQITETRAGAVRLVSLRLNKAQKETAEKSQHFSKFVGAFLEAEIHSPFRYKQVSPTAFAINGLLDEKRFDAYIYDLHEKLMEFLFGTERCSDCNILFFAGSDIEVAKFITEPEEDAIARSQRFMKRLAEDQEQADRKSSASNALRPIAGKRPLLYRGILACPQQVLLAYAITPSLNPDPTAIHNQEDIDLARYLDFRGKDAISFSIRIFDKASYLLQTSESEMRSVVLLVPISYKSLLSKQDRQAFLNNMADHPDWVRDQIFLSVFNAPDYPSSSVMQGFVGEFSSRFRTIDWQVTRPDFDLSLFLSCRFHSITLDLYQAGSQREKFLEAFLKRIPELRAKKIRPGVSGINTTSELLRCLDAKMVYASGNAVTAPLPSPAPAQKVSSCDLPVLEPTVLSITREQAA